MDNVTGQSETLLAYARSQRKARRQHNHIANWYGRRGGSSRRVYVCYVCDSTIDQESARWPQTRHALTAINEHAAAHLAEISYA